MKYIVRYVDQRLGTVEKLESQIPGLILYRDAFGSQEEIKGISAFIVALRLAGNDPAVIMEDDIELCSDFCRKAEAVIATRTHSVISFFSYTKRKSGYYPNFSWLQCAYFPAGYCNRIADFYPAWNRHQKGGLGVDWLVKDWLKVRREPFWLHCPSLVQHLPLESVIDPTLSRRRQSPTFTR
jgi:hypothetical protein